MTAPDPRPLRHFDDLALGDRFETAAHLLAADEVIAFAREWDPQPFHVDPEAARDSLFGRHVASGWHLTALMMRLIVTQGWRTAGGVIGLRIDELVFHATPPGESLRLVGEVIELRPSRSKPDRGLARVRFTMLNARDEPALSCIATQVILRKSAA